jgi:hypothetical protein
MLSALAAIICKKVVNRHFGLLTAGISNRPRDVLSLYSPNSVCATSVKQAETVSNHAKISDVNASFSGPLHPRPRWLTLTPVLSIIFLNQFAPLLQQAAQGISKIHIFLSHRKESSVNVVKLKRNSASTVFPTSSAVLNLRFSSILFSIRKTRMLPKISWRMWP